MAATSVDWTHSEEIVSYSSARPAQLVVLTLAVLGDGLLELVERDLGVLDNEGDLEHLDAVADGDELGSTPDEAVNLNGTDAGLEGGHVGLVVPRLNLEGDDRLGDGKGLAGGDLLVLLGLLGGGVGGNTLLLDALGLGVLLLVLTEEVNVLVVLLLGGGGGGGLGGNRDTGEGRGAGGELRGLTGVRSNVLVPAGGVGEGLELRELEGLKDGDVGRRRGVAILRVSNAILSIRVCVWVFFVKENLKEKEMGSDSLEKGFIFNAYGEGS